MKQLFLTAVALISLPMPTVGKTIYVGGWDIDRYPTVCTASRDFADRTSIDLDASLDGEDGSITFWNDDWKSIVDGRRYTISLSLDRSPKTRYQATGMNGSSHHAGLMIILVDSDKLMKFANAERLYVWRGGKRIGNYKMIGSKAAVFALGRCVQRSHPKADPFKN